MFLVRNNILAHAWPCAIFASLSLIAIPAEALAKPVEITTFMAAAAMKNVGKGQPKSASTPATRSAKKTGASASSAKNSFGKKGRGKNGLNVMKVIRGSQLALRFYPKGREVALNARICLKKGAGFLTFQRKAGGMVTYGDDGCNVVTKGGPPRGKKSGGTWPGP